jgi:hypothetical protein
MGHARRFQNIGPVYSDDASKRLFQPSDATHQSRFSGAVRPDQSCYRSNRNPEGNIVDGALCIVFENQPLNCDEFG